MDKIQAKLSYLTNFIPLISFVLGAAIFISTSLMSVSCIVLAIVTILSQTHLIKQLRTSFNSRLIVGYVSLYICFIIGCLWSTADYHAISAILFKVICFILAPILLIGFRVKDAANQLLKGFVIAGAITVILSIVCFSFNHPILRGVVDNAYGGSAWVIFHGHILHNVFLSIASIIVLNILLDKAREQTKLVNFMYIALYIAFFIDIFYIVDGRTGWVTFVVMHFITLFYRFKIRGLLFSCLAFIILAPMVYYSSPVIKAGVHNYQSDQALYLKHQVNSSFGLREDFHKNSLALIKQKPYFGYGTGSFSMVYKSYISQFNGITTKNPHSDWAWIGVELGGFGLIGFIFMLLASYYSFYKLEKFYKLIGLSLLGAYFIASFENSFFIDNVSGVTFILLSLALVSANDYYHARLNNAKSDEIIGEK